MDSPDMVLIGRLPLPKWLPSDPEDARLTLAILGACKLLNVRPGIWITGTWPIPWAIFEPLPSDRLQQFSSSVLNCLVWSLTIVLCSC